MKKVILVLPLLVLITVVFMGQSRNDKNIDDLISPDMLKLIATGEPSTEVSEKPIDFVWSTEPAVHSLSNGEAIVSPNFRPYPSTNTNQSEVIIVRHPLNQDIMWASANMTTIGGPLFISEGNYVTTNSGANWFGSDTITSQPINNHSGDPGPIIDKDGTFLMSHLIGSFSLGIGVSRSTNLGMSWDNIRTISSSSSNDKNLGTTDGTPSSPYYGNSYVYWTDFAPSTKPIALSRSTNGGQNWTPPVNVSAPTSPYLTSQGCDGVVGSDGTVYVTWRDHQAVSPFTGKRVGMARSTNGGANWIITTQIFEMNGTRSASFGSYGIRTNDFPRIDIDRSGGPRHNWIYIVTPQANLAPAGTDSDIILNRSTDGGLTWSSGIRVNQDPLNNGKLQFFPAIRVDEQGGVNVVYYDNRNTASDSAEIYVSRSLDGGDTWDDILVSDHRFRPRAISGLAGGYAGDYIGITSGNAKVWPVWMDNSTGNYQLWAASITIANNPLNPFNLQSPAAGVTIESFPNGSSPITIDWDTSALGSSYKWIFGSPSTNPRLITIPSGSNQITLTTGQLDNVLAGLGLNTGDQLVGQWDVWAFRPNPPQNDSLKASNGPRAITLRRGVPQLQAFNLLAPPNNSTIETSIFNTDPVQVRWSRSGDGTTYKWKFGSPTLGNNLLSISSDGNGFDSTLSTTFAALDGILAGIGVTPGDSLNGEWAVYAYNGVDSLKSVQTYNITLKRSSVTALFYDDFSGGTGQWNISNDGGTCEWEIFTAPYPNAYTMPATSNSPVFSADSDECGNGTTLNSTATVGDNINCAGYTNITLEWDNDFRHFNASSVARTQVSYNGGSTWETLVEWSGVSKRNSFENFSLPNATNIPNLKIRFVSIQPGWHWWWTIDNVTVKGDIITDVAQTGSEIPSSYNLSQNFPNPFNPVTKINFAIPKQGFVSMKIFDVTGREVANLVNEVKAPGYYSVDFNASVLSSGVYLYRLESADFLDVKRMVLIK